MWWHLQCEHTQEEVYTKIATISKKKRKESNKLTTNQIIVEQLGKFANFFIGWRYAFESNRRPGRAQIK
jgi:hypothetical protein